MKKSTSLFSEYLLLSDSALISKTLADEQGAFDALISRYQALLFHLACHYLKDVHAAEDVLQHVWMQLYLSLSNLSSRKTLRPWLQLVTRNACLDELRKRRRRKVIYFSELNTERKIEDALQLAAIQDHELLPEEKIELSVQQQELQQAMQQLPIHFRKIVYLHCIGQLNFREIGHKLKMPSATVKTYYYRALPGLRTALAHENMS